MNVLLTNRFQNFNRKFECFSGKHICLLVGCWKSWSLLLLRNDDKKVDKKCCQSEKQNGWWGTSSLWNFGGFSEWIIINVWIKTFKKTLIKAGTSHVCNRVHVFEAVVIFQMYRHVDIKSVARTNTWQFIILYMSLAGAFMKYLNIVYENWAFIFL